MDITVFMKQHLENQATIIALLQGQAGGTTTTTAKTTAAAGKKPAAKKPTVTKSQATAAVKKVQETLGSPAARELLGSCGVAKLAEMTEADYEAVYAAANAALEGGDNETEEEDI